MRKGSQNIVHTHTIACKELEDRIPLLADWVDILYLKTEISFACFLNNAKRFKSSKLSSVNRSVIKRNE
jgi:hypothetical protein